MTGSSLFRLFCLKSLVLALALSACAGTPAPSPRRQANIRIDGHQARVLVAVTRQEHVTGLMFREELDEDEGMLFVYDTSEVRCMWMKNTYVPLSAAFLGEDGRILGIARMDPMTTTTHCSPAPSRYVLEMNRGWFERKGLGEGSRVDLSGIPSIP